MFIKRHFNLYSKSALEKLAKMAFNGAAFPAVNGTFKVDSIN